MVLLEPEEIKALAPRRSRAIEIEQFVDLADIDPIVWDAPYYLGPGDESGGEVVRAAAPGDAERPGRWASAGS